ncbi:hypothetical protein L6467_00100 [Segatella bryantii]|uniref:hypothetical protein n=1 Tax=Segatella bryantii TaxID=77095 RepID=UPI001EDA281D|nr:hypothetical protein [Segatella bryantii]UKK72679.1 hypothetical protein L6467_00100 [Segatella bryantii]
MEKIGQNITFAKDLDEAYEKKRIVRSFLVYLLAKKTSTGRSANIGNNVYICSGTKIIGDYTNIVYIADTLRTMRTGKRLIFRLDTGT